MGAADQTATNTRVRRLKPVPALDGFRGIAVLVVIMFHTPLLMFPRATGIAPLDHALAGGYIGVDLFFVLSGFLITALLLSEDSEHGSIGLGSFYIRRALRLLPALYVMLAAFFVYSHAVEPPPVGSTSTIGYALVYLSNWQQIWHPFTNAGMDHLWSLAVEEQFYLLWPLVLIVLLRLRKYPWIVAMALVAAVIAVAIHRADVWNDTQRLEPLLRSQGYLHSGVGTDTRADTLLIGVLLAWLWVHGKTPKRGVAMAAWIASGTLVYSVLRVDYTSSWPALGFSDVVAIAAAVVILAAVDTQWIAKRFLELRPLRLVGRVSYGLYLWHFPIFYAVARHAGSQYKVVRVVLAYGLTVLFAWLSWMLVERPALRLKHRLERNQDVSVALPSA